MRCGRCVKMSNRLVLSAKGVLKGKVDVQNIQARYVLLKPGFSYYETIIRAINYMAKFGWRAVSFSRGYCLMEKLE